MYDTSTRVLIADDMKTFRMFLADALGELGFTNIIEATDGLDAWAKLNQEKSTKQLILADLAMPFCDGMSLLKKVRADETYRDVPFIMVTAEGEPLEMNAAIELGVSGYILKPVNSGLLRSRLESIYKKATKQLKT
jgi:two-component system chemotaxis response regulator CheY